MICYNLRKEDCMETLETLSQTISTQLLQLGQSSLKVLVALCVALLIMVLGLYISRLVSSFVKKMLGKISFDEKTSKLGVNELCMRFGLGKSPTYIIAFVLAWAVIFYAVVLAAEVLHLEVIRNLFTQRWHTFWPLWSSVKAWPHTKHVDMWFSLPSFMRLLLSRLALSPRRSGNGISYCPSAYRRPGRP